MKIFFFNREHEKKRKWDCDSYFSRSSKSFRINKGQKFDEEK